MKNTRLLVLVGSRRQGSYNASLAAFLKSLAPGNVTWIQPDLFQLPFYEEDLQTSGAPESVLAFQEECRKADAVLVVSPEYNWSIPGVVKNALDWGSRPFPEIPVGKKPTMIAGASVGPLGTGRMNLALRQVLAYLKADVTLGPDIYVPHAAGKFSPEGLTDEGTKEAVKKNFLTFLQGVEGKLT